MKLPYLLDTTQFPPTTWAMSEPNGLLAFSTDIDADWLQAAYERGVFPWYSPGEPVLWWSPSPRAVLYTESFKLHRSLRKRIAQQRQVSTRSIRLNTAFETVIRACAEPREGQAGTWITEEVIAAYTSLHRRGLAHSVEHWNGNQLVGGLYCVALGGMVYGESMFSRETDASKVAFAHFVYWLICQNVFIIDCQQATRHLMSMGACSVPREQFEAAMAKAQSSRGPQWFSGVLPWTGPDSNNDSS